MFSAHCVGCGTEVLLTTRRILVLDNTDRGIVVVFRCWQGHIGTWLTGRAVHDGRASHAVPRRPASQPIAAVGAS